jgi:hypothetical protein
VPSPRAPTRGAPTLVRPSDHNDLNTPATSWAEAVCLHAAYNYESRRARFPAPAQLAQFRSFNFANNLIWAVGSSARDGCKLEHVRMRSTQRRRVDKGGREASIDARRRVRRAHAEQRTASLTFFEDCLQL